MLLDMLFFFLEELTQFSPLIDYQNKILIQYITCRYILNILNDVLDGHVYTKINTQTIAVSPVSCFQK